MNMRPVLQNQNAIMCAYYSNSQINLSNTKQITYDPDWSGPTRGHMDQWLYIHPN
jgi:hypothetical protein